MASPIDTADLFRRPSGLEYRLDLTILGVPVRFAANHPELLVAVEESFGHWRRLAASSVPSEAPGVDVALVLRNGAEGVAAGSPVTVSMPDPARVIVRGPGSMAASDLHQRSSVVQVSRPMMFAPERLRATVIEGATLLLVTAQDRTPLHAAAIAQGNTALLLAGPSGSGKSTLAYAATRAGFTLLADDAVYVQLQPPRLWGVASRVLLLEDAAARFPELTGRAAVAQGNGKMKVAVSLESPPAAAPPVARVGVVLLDRSRGSLRCEPLPPKRIRDALLADLTAVRDIYGQRLDEAAAWAAGRGGWRLALSSDLAEGVAQLQRLARELEA